MLDKQQAAQGPAEIDEQEQRFSKARRLLIDLVGLPDLRKVFDDEECLEARRVDTQAPTLTQLIRQRLKGGLSLSAAVQQLLTHHRDLLPAKRRVEERTLPEKQFGLEQSSAAVAIQESRSIR
jgi:hypothetical protein